MFFAFIHLHRGRVQMIERGGVVELLSSSLLTSTSVGKEMRNVICCFEGCVNLQMYNTPNNFKMLEFVYVATDDFVYRCFRTSFAVNGKNPLTTNPNFVF